MQKNENIECEEKEKSLTFKGRKKSPGKKLSFEKFPKEKNQEKWVVC